MGILGKVQVQIARAVRCSPKLFKLVALQACNDLGKKLRFTDSNRNARQGYNFFRAYNTNGHEGNLVAKHITFRFCRYRSQGTVCIRVPMDELKTMYLAISDELNHLFSSNKCQAESWLLPIVYMMNYHLRYYTKLPPVAVRSSNQERRQKERRVQGTT